MKNACVISCIFGGKFTEVHPAPSDYDCYFFSNSEAIKTEVENKGWKFEFVDVPLSNDVAASSLQAKYVKFLQFRLEERWSCLSSYKTVIYHDHKIFLRSWQIKLLIDKQKNASVLIRVTPRLKETIWDEVNAAKGQERYARFMPETIDFINKEIESGCSEKVRICSTGLIFYKIEDPAVFKLVDEVYDNSMKIGTSECQIIWGMISQKYQSIIKTFTWDTPAIRWAMPSSTVIIKENECDLVRESGLFDIDYYVNEQVPALKKTPNPPLFHFMEYGWKEGRKPNEKFDCDTYLEANKDVKELALGLNPLVHYIRNNKKNIDH